MIAHLMLREPGRVVTDDRLERVVGVARIEVVEDAVHPLQQRAAALQRLDRVAEGRRLVGAGDCRDLGRLFGHAA